MLARKGQRRCTPTEKMLENWLQRLKYSITFWPQSSLFPHLLSGWRLRVQRASLVNKDQVYDHLKNLNIFNSMGPGETHPRVLNELGDAVSKPLFIIFEKLWQKLWWRQSFWKKGNIVPIFENGRKELWTCQPHLCALEKSWNRFSWNMCWDTWRTRRRLKTIITTKGKSLFVERQIQWVECYTDKKNMIEWSHSECKQLKIPMKISDKWFPSVTSVI